MINLKTMHLRVKGGCVAITRFSSECQVARVVRPDSPGLAGLKVYALLNIIILSRL